MFCSNGGSSHYKYKDSLSNILSTKEFVVNFATSSTRNQMNNLPEILNQMKMNLFYQN